jgi:hypothetical protein
MAPETSAQAPSATEPQPSRRRRGRSLLLLGAAAVATVTAATLWITGAGTGTKIAAAGTAATPAPVPSAVATPGAGVSGAVSAAGGTVSALANSSGPHNLLLSGDGSLDTTVTTYSDCSGATELTHSAAAVDTCVSGRTYFVGHNAGVFTPLLDLGVRDIITYYDNDGAAHRLRIVAVRDNWLRADGVPPLANSDVVAQFQTCETAYPDGSHDRILDAVPA